MEMEQETLSDENKTLWFLLHIGGLLAFIWRICECSCLYERGRERESKKYLPELTLLHGVTRMEKNGEYMKTTRIKHQLVVDWLLSRPPIPGASPIHK